MQSLVFCVLRLFLLVAAEFGLYLISFAIFPYSDKLVVLAIHGLLLSSGVTVMLLWIVGFRLFRFLEHREQRQHRERIRALGQRPISGLLREAELSNRCVDNCCGLLAAIAILSVPCWWVGMASALYYGLGCFTGRDTGCEPEASFFNLMFGIAAWTFARIVLDGLVVICIPGSACPQSCCCSHHNSSSASDSIEQFVWFAWPFDGDAGGCTSGGDFGGGGDD